MLKDSVKRVPDFETPAGKNVAWFLLGRRQSSGCNMTIVVQCFEPGGSFEEHAHDLEQFFYVTKGRMELGIGDDVGVYEEGEFVSVDRNLPHSGRNLGEGESELLVVDYWPADSDDRIGLD
ncbi:MAG: cupin domain-containing protein [Gemmatimonadetes bacterium]|jgi:quercetin dioxygenase-like cupin family protein|nr:cupin domain-containing protein [Gemmatimonadota bacterium]